jgi:outer membrane lipoprotein-sorting protein
MHVFSSFIKGMAVLALLATSPAWAQTAPVFPKTLPFLPPERPHSGSIPTASPKPNPSIPVTPESLSDEEVVARVNAFFNGFTTLQADFQQTNADDSRLTGVLAISRPGKLRFQYNPPSPLEIISDGSSLVLLDRKLATQDLYSLSQTPLKFLTQKVIDVTKSSRVRGILKTAEGIRITLEDSSTLGGTSRIYLYFNGAATQLQQWIVTDPQGMDTRVVLSNVQKNAALSPDLFVINYERVLQDRQ